jgi:hypothetical protein
MTDPRVLELLERIAGQRTDNRQGIAAASQQAFVTWGRKQFVSAGPLTADVVYSFPDDGADPLVPNLKGFEQLVDMRYKRPTTWSVHLYIANEEFMAAGSSFRMTWRVNVSVGQASIQLRMLTEFIKTTGANQVVLLTQQFAAHTIQIIPEALTIVAKNVEGGTLKQDLSWAAWIAPVVD